MRQIDQQLTRDYEQRRRQNERERDERVQQASNLDPQIPRLQQQLRGRFAQSARRMLHEPGQSEALSQALLKDVARIQTEIRERLDSLGLPRDHMELHYRCTACRDTGYLSEFERRMCDCYQRARTALMRESANLLCVEGQSFDAFDPDIFPSEPQRKEAHAALALCRRFADGIKGGGKPNLILMGESGLGKTFLLNCVADRAIQLGVPALPVTAFHMLAAMRAYHFGENGDGALLSQMIQCELLLIDDLGSEPMLRNITVEYLFMLLNERTNAHRHTVVATNLTPNDLLERYNERVLSRLLDRNNGEILRLTGKDLRLFGQRKREDTDGRG